MSKRMWEIVETETRKGRVAKTEGGRKEGGRGKETRRKGDRKKAEEEAEERKNDRGEEGSRRIGNLG